MRLNINRWLMHQINTLGHNLPKPIQRMIADFPGILAFLEKSSQHIHDTIATPEGYRMVINPLFHANLQTHGDLSGYEPDIRQALQQLTSPGMVAYDIGANVGVFTFLFASSVGSDGHVYAFEPEPNNYQCLRESIELNSTSNITLDTRAVSCRAGYDQFDRRGGAFSGRLIFGNDVYSKTKNVIDVQTISIDQLVNDGIRPPNIVKIDVEGNENLVLEGMQNTLQTTGPIILCELHTHLGESSELVWDTLSRYGYKIFSIENVVEHGLIQAEPLTNLAGINYIVAIRD